MSLANVPVQREYVYLEPNKMDSVPFTTSKVIAEFSGIEHRKLKVSIRKYGAELEGFGLLTPYEAESTGGRRGLYYRLNDPQATFLMTLLKNTPAVIQFKKELVRQFYAMREELMKRHVERKELKPIRMSLTDAIRDYLPDSPHKRYAYKHFTDLAYKMAFGLSAVQLRELRSAPKNAIAIDYMTSKEIEEVKEATYKLAALITMGMVYEQIRELVMRRLAA